MNHPVSWWLNLLCGGCSLVGITLEYKNLQNLQRFIHIPLAQIALSPISQYCFFQPSDHSLQAVHYYLGHHIELYLRPLFSAHKVITSGVALSVGRIFPNHCPLQPSISHEVAVHFWFVSTNWTNPSLKSILVFSFYQLVIGADPLSP